ncbi:MAG: hypothetical protein A3F46_05300 [Legionellales bacterium RIFCSPHIGHO2_12_FULL_42_9]|nr:MAG: hypothetical protein A3F46_05300 [Legionellales bacterium RIFCSPHIGHO2_12_FULL_42_9]
MFPSSVIDTLRKYPQIELLSREKSHALYQLITECERNKSPLAYLLALGIPVFSALNIASKLTSDSCRAIDTLIQTIRQREYAGGNIQTLGVDFAEYGRSFSGCLAGALVGLYSPSYAAETFLTIAADPTVAFLTPDEGARLYAMADGLHAFFIKHRIDYRICSGTALGAIREKGIIRNDDDIDLMLHPNSEDSFRQLVEEGTFTKETGISIVKQPITGGLQCFYSDSPKGQPGTPTEHVGKPFIDIFTPITRLLGNQPIITYGEEKMYLQSKGDYFTPQEWGEEPTLYPFGPTQLCGVEPQAMKTYISRCYGESALHYKTLLYPHEVYSAIYATPLRAFSILAQHPVPRYMRHTEAAPLDFDHSIYEAKRALANPNLSTEVTVSSNPEELRIFVDGVFDLFHQGHQNIIKNAIKSAQEKHPDRKIVLFIGVCGDGADVKDYKRQPLMTLQQRCEAIDAYMQELIKNVSLNVSAYRILPNSPVTHTLEFIKRYGLNIIFHGSDFTQEKIDQYYGVIMRECAGTCSLAILPYTKGVSTTELILHLLQDRNFGDTPNTTGIAIELLAEQVQQREEEFTEELQKKFPEAFQPVYSNSM